MPIVRSDDAARRLRFIYLGPPSMRWPAASFPAYGLFLALAGTGVVTTFLTMPNLGVWLLFELPAVLLGSALLVRWVFRRVDADTPLMYQLSTLRAEITAPRPPKPARVHATAIPAHLFTDHRESNR
jgi:hypothetical protein